MQAHWSEDMNINRQNILTLLEDYKELKSHITVKSDAIVLDNVAYNRIREIYGYVYKKEKLNIVIRILNKAKEFLNSLAFSFRKKEIGEIYGK